MPLLRHRHDDDEERDWRERRGRFEGLDRDTPDRPQVMPVPRPPTDAQTHTRKGAAGRFRDGPDYPDDPPEPITGYGGVVAPKPGGGGDGAE